MMEIPPDSPAIHLHIGRNKAGSTTLQEYLGANADWLAAHGVRYALSGHLAGTIAGLPSLANHFEIIDAFRAVPAQSLLISNEMISAFPSDLTEIMARDMATVDTRVIMYVRPYLAWVGSSYGFDVRTGRNGRDFDLYLDYMAPRISFWPNLEIWGRTLGWDRVRVRSTDPADLLDGDLVRDCIAAIGLRPPATAHATRSNAMAHWMATELLRAIIGRDDASGWDPAGLAAAHVLHDLIDTAIQACGAGDVPAQYATPRQAERLAALFNRDIEAVRVHTGIRLCRENAGDVGERPFLPSIGHIPPRLLRAVAALATSPACEQAHPEAAAFIRSAAYAARHGEGPPDHGLAAHARATQNEVEGAAASLTDKESNRMDEAMALADRGALREAIAVAARHGRAGADDRLLAALVRWRRDAFTPGGQEHAAQAWPPNLADPFPGQTGIPVIPVAELTAEIMGGAILHHGSLRVNGLVSPAEAEELRLGIDRALAARDAARAADWLRDDGWYVRLDVANSHARDWVEHGGAVWTADCPPMLYDVIDAFTRCGMIDHITSFMGERPALSVGKSTLRRVPASTDTDWHQDGAFLGRDVRAVNIWLALSPCGVDAPGLDVVGKRLPYVVQTGSHGAHFDWSVGPGVVDMLAEGGAPVEAPEFAPGDALLFDHMMLHRTGVRPGMTRPRWAIESWFFSPTHYPMEQVPLVV